MSSRAWWMLVLASWIVAVVGPITAHAQARREAYAHAQVAGGYWHYWQSGYADRELDGGALEVRGAFAWWLGDEIALGTTIGFDLFYGSGHSLLSSSTYGPELAPGGLWGLLLMWAPAGDEPPVALEISAGIAGGGDPHWGGGGPYVSPGLTIFVAHFGRSHLGITLRAQYEPMFSDDATPHGAVKNFVMASAAFGWTFF